MCLLLMLRVSLVTQTLDDWGLGERCFRGRGEADLERRDLLYRFLERDRDELLPLLLLLLLLLLEDRLGGLSFAFDGPFADGDADFLAALEVSAGFFRSLEGFPLEALLLREELPDELDRLEPEELERDPELERLELLLPDDELLQITVYS